MNIGDRFGRLVVIAAAPKRKYQRYWLMRCDCGREKEARESHLKNNLIQSCGCQSVERIVRLNKRHGMSHTPTHYVWRGMKQRCYTEQNPAFKNYGGRGIKVCDRWLHFENFLADMGERPDGMELERIDNNGNYEPGNCRWATVSEQARNKRTTRFLTHNGETLPMVVWAERLGTTCGTLSNRLNQLGWDVARAVTQEVRR